MNPAAPPPSPSVVCYLTIPEAIGQLTSLFQFMCELLRLEAAGLAGGEYSPALRTARVDRVEAAR